MPPEEDTPPNPETPPTGSPAPAAPEGGAPPAPEPPAAPQAKSQPSVNHLSNKALAEAKSKERERGRKAALAEMDRKAQKLGYKNHQDMLEKLEQQRARGRGGNGTQPKPASEAAPATPAVSDRQLTRAQKENQRLVDAARRANRARAQEEKRRRDIERQLAATEARHELHLAAVRAGVKDVDYAIHLLERRMSGKTEDELKGFDEEEFFSKTLRESHPYLYGVEERPAGSAGPKDQEPKPPPKPADKLPATNGGSDKTDARKMSNEEYTALLRKRGLTPPGFGMPG
jgi:hypothetical protein